MRPLRLTLRAFGPYAGTEVVDFDALSELGLFVVAGNNGSGKSTIFDALHYSLFGTLPGRRATYLRLKSDHAGANDHCQVTLEFSAHGALWRVERSPKQQRAKRRGTGTTVVERQATLYRLDEGLDGTAITLANRITDVDERCRELVGLSGKQFERVALLPQGEFSRVLRESTSERRDLLRTLFSSDIFGDATSLLNDRAAEATAKDRSVLDRLGHRQAALTEELRGLSTFAALSGSETPPAQALQRALDSYRSTELTALARKVSADQTTAAQATSALERARDLQRRLERRSAVAAELKAHTEADPVHQQDLTRLEDARAAVPVAGLANTLSQQEQRCTAAQAAVDGLTAKLAAALKTAGLRSRGDHSEDALTECADAVDALASTLERRREAALRVTDLSGVVGRTETELRRRGNELTGLAQQREVLHARRRRAQTELQQLETVPSERDSTRVLNEANRRLELRASLAQFDDQRDGHVAEQHELDLEIRQLERDHEIAQGAHQTAGRLQLKADSATAALTASNDRLRAVRAFIAERDALISMRAKTEKAQREADAVWDAYIAGTAARVAQTLVPGDPCPVCGSGVHPIPAPPPEGGRPPTDADVASARAELDECRSKLRAIEACIESLSAATADIASLSEADVEAEITTAKAMALGSRAAADEAFRHGSKAGQIADQLRVARERQKTLSETVSMFDAERNQLRGALGDAADLELDVIRDEQRVAEANVEAAKRRQDQLATVSTELADIEQTIETVGIAQIVADSRRKSTADKLDDLQDEQAKANSALSLVDAELVELIGQDIEPTNLEQQVTACRQARQVIGELTTALALLNDAHDGVRRARSMLDDRVNQSKFASVNEARNAFLAAELVQQLDAQTAAYIATGDRLRGQLHELESLPGEPPDLAQLEAQAEEADLRYTDSNRRLISITTQLERMEHDLGQIVAERHSLESSDTSTRRLERVAALVKGDNDRNTSLENWVLAAHLRDVVELANLRLAQSTHQRFQLCVLDDGESKRGTWGIDLGVEDTVTGTRRPTAGLSGGELFQASLALALGLADAVMNQSAGVHIDALFIDEGFGSLDEVSVERAIDLLDELRDRGAMVGVITHVPALLDALPRGITVSEASTGGGSVIHQDRRAA